MTKLAFTKMQGLGNDFMVIDGITQSVTLSADRIRAWADRHYGIGFDQLLLIEPPPTPDVAFFYRIFNADGSEVAQCGNGARCVAQFAYTRGLVTTPEFAIATRAGQLHLRIINAQEVTVDMGHPEWQPAAIPFQTTAIQPQPVYPLSVATNQVDVGVVSMGNPHCVVIVTDITTAPVETLGRALATHPAFPAGVNVGFMQILKPSHVRLRVLERGAGETLACGSGACAAVAVGRLQGLLAATVTVDLPGGSLMIHWPDAAASLLMTGPACFVFDGEIA